MYTLYYMPGTCSMAVHTMLHELNQPAKFENVRDAEGKTKPEYLKVNPRGNVPVLMDGDHMIREGGAILSYLMDKHNSPMLPKSGPERATALEWLMFANATMHPAYARVFFIMRTVTDKAAKEEALKAAYAAINKNWAEVDAQLAKTPYVCGKECSAADILLTVIANWGMGAFASNFTFGENTKRMIKAVSARPAFQKAMEMEHVEYKAAA